MNGAADAVALANSRISVRVVPPLTSPTRGDFGDARVLKSLVLHGFIMPSPPNLWFLGTLDSCLPLLHYRNGLKNGDVKRDESLFIPLR